MSLKIVQRHKSPNWYIRGTVDGIRYEETTGTTSREKAEEIRVKREAFLLDQKIHGKKATATFAMAALSYLEDGGDERFLEPIAALLADMELRNISQKVISDTANMILPNSSNSTKNRQVFTPISAILNHAAKCGWCDKPILSRPRQSRPRFRWLKIDEADELIEAADDHLKPLLIFLFYTGARVGEALKLDWKDLDLGRSHVTFPKTKNGDARGIPLHPRVVECLKEYRHSTGRVFLDRTGKPYRLPKNQSGSETSHGSVIRYSFQKAVEAANIEDFRPHDCRHTFATWHYRENRDLAALMRLGGWKSISMVMRYTHSNVDEHRATIDALPGGNWGK